MPRDQRRVADTFTRRTTSVAALLLILRFHASRLLIQKLDECTCHERSRRDQTWRVRSLSRPCNHSFNRASPRSHLPAQRKRIRHCYRTHTTSSTNANAHARGAPSPSESREPLITCWSSEATSVCMPALPNLETDGHITKERREVSSRRARTQEQPLATIGTGSPWRRQLARVRT